MFDLNHRPMKKIPNSIKADLKATVIALITVYGERPLSIRVITFKLDWKMHDTRNSE